MWMWPLGAESLPLDPVGEECEAFLAGRWVEYVSTRGEPIPTWGWLNRIAHADERELRDAARALENTGRHTDEWSRATFFLAGEILAVAERTGRPVAELQATILVPLELELFDDPSALWLTPGRLTKRVLDVLDRTVR